MRITHFLLGRCNPDSANGVDKTVYHLSKAQAMLGHDVAVFSITAKPAIPIERGTVKTYSPEKLPIRLPRGLVEDLFEWKPDVVHLHSVYIPQNAILAKHLRSRRIPYVVTPNGGLSPYVLRRRWYLKVPYRLLVERPYLNRATFVHAVTDQKDIRHYGVKVPIVVASNGVDVALIPDNLNPNAIVNRFPNFGSKRIFVFLGRLDIFHKGLDLLVHGFQESLKGTSAILILVGPDWRGDRRQLEKLVQNLGISSQVFFLGPAYGKEKFDLLASADVFVHTSRWEGASFSVLEALACGKPCLLTQAADPTGLIEQHRAGVVVRTDVKDIARGFQEMAALDRSELRSMGSKARAIVELEFNWEGIARTLTKAYLSYAVSK